MRSLQYQRLKLVILGALLFGISNAQNLVFTSGYSSSEQSFLLDLQAGTLSEAGQQDVEPNLTFMDISPDGRDIYLVHEVTQYDGFGDNGAVSLWRKGRDIMGKPIFGKIQTFSANGTGTCHVKIHSEYGLVHVANYASGSFTSLKIDADSGEFEGLVYNEYYGKGSNVKPDRQEYAHAHGTWTFGPFVYVADLGSDKIWHYKATGVGELSKTVPPFTATPPGHGPRHMAIDAERKLAYVVFELESVVGVYEINESNGALTEKFLVDLMPEPSASDYAAEIEISPSRQHLYVSNRANGAIVVYAILPDGNLDRIQVQYVGGPTPRHFKIHPSGEFLLVALQDSSALELYRIDAETGLLEMSQSMACPNKPTIVGLLNL